MGDLAITTSEGVLVEAVYVLSSKALYNLPRSAIRTRLIGIITLQGLKLPRKRTYLHALDLYASTRTSISSTP